MKHEIFGAYIVRADEGYIFRDDEKEKANLLEIQVPGPGKVVVLTNTEGELKGWSFIPEAEDETL